MNEPRHVSPELSDLIDEYLSGSIDEARLGDLEKMLSTEEGARRHFVRYCRMHTDLYLSVHVRKAGERALRSIAAESGDTPRSRRPLFEVLSLAISRALIPWTLRKACLWVLTAGILALAAAGAGVRWKRGDADLAGAAGADRNEAIAWLINAQDCRWAKGMAPSGDMGPGRTLRIERGLAEIGFEGGARVLLEGPASLELLSSSAARLLHGKATANVPESARGFTILSPQGKVVDLGTEFGISVSGDGITEVVVFEGQVEAASSGGQPSAQTLTLGESETALIDEEGITSSTDPEGLGGSRFVRRIEPLVPLTPRVLKLDFRQASEGSLQDAGGLGTGLTHRLPGTGEALRERDANLRLNREEGQLELTTTNSDINTQFQLPGGEYVGIRLADLGFKGTEDFAVMVSIPNIPRLEFIGQFGIFAGTRSDRNIRGGLISRQDPDSYSLFLVNNDGGRDSDLYTVGLLSTGVDLRLTLRRTGGKYTLTIENQTEGSSSTLSIRHPPSLDDEEDLVVGVFGANTQSEVRRTLILKELEATVWTRLESP
ncbi:MAG TPA: FecR family protein [Planctomycetota bacterium]|nr:FecR family protein [Planctomycetota bacterium]